MATNIQIKRSTGTTAPGTLLDGELAYTHGTGTQGNNGDRLFIGDGSSVKVIGGEYFSGKLDHADGTLTASSALTVDSNSAVNTLNVGNHATTGGQVLFKEGTNNGAHSIGLKSPNALAANVVFTLPATDGSSGQFLQTNASGVLSFATVTQSLSLAADSGSNDTFNTGETLTFTGGSGISTTVSNNEITHAIAAGAITNDQLGGSIANAKLVNDGITIGSTDTSLGGTITALAGMTQIAVDNITLNANTISTTNSNGDLVLSPNGSGSVTVPSGYEGRAGFGSDSIVNKSYVDSVANGLDVKASVRGATTANLTATYNNSAGTLTANSNGALVVDGVTYNVGERILVKDQSTAAQNGFYKVTAKGSGSAVFVLTRTPDADAASELTGGAFTFAEEGSANGDNGYVLATNGSITLGTTAINFEQFSGAGQIDAGAGLTKTGNTINVIGTSGKITVSSNAVTIASDYVGQNTITTLGTITTGVWNGTDIGVAHGGTGLSAAAKGSVLIANDANTISALDGGGSDDGILLYTSSSDTISWATTVDGGTF